MQQTAHISGVSRSTVHAALRRHAQRHADNPAYEELVARVLRTAVRRSIPLPSHPLALPARVAAGSESVVLMHGGLIGTDRSG